ncbi:uncharacterized protein PHALS_13980 [Plasmopara halstedii]|uniref:Uncharacterized protein n=1 Tax=Plasmopara halstedii TaxID=4781 RepID=A0A0P1AQR0_PLAHL|nr:uncharacterized protein PHALS_13980 [Plasmopara halstedii]CEG43685.1 hypothetical protein PHALS_13980 [Plasmopara halstedii]|eukprot:XP_024580054.1 hypothetical protein PHALS_13980 [Plasmopara halstedii]
MFTPPSNNSDLLYSPTSKELNTGTAYTTMDEGLSPNSHERAFSKFEKMLRKDSMADLVRGLLQGARSNAATKSVAIYISSVNDSALSLGNNAFNEVKDDLWIVQEEHERQMECTYRCLADEMSI